MKKLFKTTLCLFMLMNSLWAQAQVQLGIKAGVNSSTINIPDIEPGVSVKPRIDFQGGVVLDIPVASSFSIQSALLVSAKGSKIKAKLIDGNTGSTISDINTSIKLVYTELPVLALFKKNLGQSCRFYGGVGPYVGLGLGGKIASSFQPIAERDVNFGSGEPGTNSYRRFDYGASAAAGVEINRLLIGVNYNYGLVDLGSAINKSYNRTLGISVGFWLSKAQL